MSTTANTAAAAAATAAAEDAKLNHLVVTQLQKTKMCAMHQRGTCRDPKCSFAHSPDELKPTPDLTKTAICRMYTRGQCRNSGCKFAHGEQELRVTPLVYKTQLCNFFARGNCNKGKRCRHAHGDEELRQALAPQAQQGRSRPPSPPLSEAPSAGDADALPYRNPGLVEDVMPNLATPPHHSAGRQQWGPMAPPAEWWAAMLAAGGPNIPALTTPPPSSYSAGVLQQPTPEKVMPQFPGVQRHGPDSPNGYEPMKVALPTTAAPGFSAPSPAPLRLPFSSPPSPFDSAPAPYGNDMMNLDMYETKEMLAAKQAALAWSAQAAHQAKMDYELAARMEYELAAAKLKVKELQAKRHLFNAAQYAATQKANAPESHFESIMQTLQQQQMPTRPCSPADMVAMQMQMPLAPTPPPPGLDLANNGVSSGSPIADQDEHRAFQSWHPSDISLQRGTAWVI